MRNAMPMRWIEQAEARQVLVSSELAVAPTPPWCNKARASATRWLPRLGAWLAERHPLGWPAVQLQPVPIRHQTVRAVDGSGDSEDYRRRW